VNFIFLQFPLMQSARQLFIDFKTYFQIKAGVRIITN